MTAAMSSGIDQHPTFLANPVKFRFEIKSTESTLQLLLDDGSRLVLTDLFPWRMLCTYFEIRIPANYQFPFLVPIREIITHV